MIKKAFLLLLTLSAVVGLVYAQQTGGTVTDQEITTDTTNDIEVTETEVSVQELVQTGGSMTGGTMTGGTMTGGSN